MLSTFGSPIVHFSTAYKPAYKEKSSSSSAKGKGKGASFVFVFVFVVVNAGGCHWKDQANIWNAASQTHMTIARSFPGKGKGQEEKAVPDSCRNVVLHISQVSPLAAWEQCHSHSKHPGSKSHVVC
jgi:hypothetical protein